MSPTLDCSRDADNDQRSRSTNDAPLLTRRRDSTHRSAEESGRGAAAPHSNHEPVAQYLAEIGRTPLLSAAEEKRATRQLANSRQRYLSAIYDFEPVLRTASQLLRHVQQDLLRIDRVTNVWVGDTARKSTIWQNIDQHLPLVDELLDAARTDFRLAIDRRRPRVQRRHAWQQVGHKRRAAAQLLAPTQIRIELVEPAFAELLAISRRMTELKQKLDNDTMHAPPEQLRNMRCELVQLMRRTQESPKTLARRIDHTLHQRRVYLRARRTLIVSNLRLVVSVARHYSDRPSVLQDLIQEGNIGLMRAVDKFDRQRKNRFATYAVWWIRQAITRALIDKHQLVRLPVSQRRAIQQLRTARQQFFVDHGHEASDHDLMEQLNLSMGDLHLWQQATNPTLSLNQIVSDSNNATLAETLADPNPANLLQQTSQHIVAAQLNTALDVLDEREQRILTLRYGLNDGCHRSLADVAKQLSVSRETIRQIEQRAFRKLLATPNFMQLRDHLEPMETY